MKKIALFSLIVMGAAVFNGCVTPDRFISDVRLGMTMDEVKYAMGDPFTIRAAKLYEGEEWMEVWEYRPPIVSLAAISEKYDKIWHIQFENGKVTMWGEPGDLNYSSTISSGQSFPVFDPKRE